MAVALRYNHCNYQFNVIGSLPQPVLTHEKHGYCFQIQQQKHSESLQHC